MIEILASEHDMERRLFHWVRVHDEILLLFALNGSPFRFLSLSTGPPRSDTGRLGGANLTFIHLPSSLQNPSGITVHRKECRSAIGELQVATERLF